MQNETYWMWYEKVTDDEAVKTLEVRLREAFAEKFGFQPKCILGPFPKHHWHVGPIHLTDEKEGGIISLAGDIRVNEDDPRTEREKELDTDYQDLKDTEKSLRVGL